MGIPGFRSEFVRHVATLLAGRSGAMLISFLLTPVIARLFIPEHFGVAAYFTAAVTVLGGVCSLNYQRAGILPKYDFVARDLLAIAFRVQTVFVLLAYLVLLFIEYTGIGSRAIESIGLWVWILPLCVWLYGASEILMSSLNREKSYRRMAVSDVSQSLTTTGSRIAVGFASGSSIGGLILTFVAGYGVRVATLRTKKWSIRELLLRHRLSWRRFLVRARQYKDFALFDTPASLARSLSFSLPVFAFGIMYTPAIVGFYAMADRLIRIPFNAIGNSIRRVYLRKIAGFRSDGKSVRLVFWKVVGMMAAIGLPALVLLVLWGTEILVFVLGDNWQGAGRYAEILAPWFYAAWVIVPVPSTMIAFRRQGLWAALQISLVFVRAAVFVLAFLLGWGAEQTLQLFVWVNVAISGFMLFLAWWVIGSTERLELAGN